ncbi:hypothetical protein PR048_023138 [Dryococelus australis]|uniref:Ankyrin repeat protein n=1 Tax=Dryococelus australis TaxID=614101 RepID=A0ABQ9GT89_9NEOP|nr:hypothetical protein PR048_023138 [Dryococelus australis]
MNDKERHGYESNGRISETRSFLEEKHPTIVEISERLASLLQLPSRVVDPRLPLTDEQYKTLNQADKHGNTQILLAAENGEKGSVEFLTWHDVDVNYRNKESQIAIDVVWEKEFCDCMLLLLEADSNFPKSFAPDQVDEIDPTPSELKFFVEQRDELHTWIKDGDVSKVKEYVSQHRLSRFLNTKGEPAVVTAAKFGNAQVMAELLKLPLAVKPGSILLTEGRRNLLKLKDIDGNTPLLLAAQAGHEEAVDLLIRCGAEINLTNKANKKAADLAWENGHYKVLFLLLNDDSEIPNGLTTDDISGSDDITKQLVSFINAREDLHSFIENGNMEAVKTFINSQGQSSKYFINSKGASALLTAIEHHQYGIYSFLISNGIHFKTQQEAECLKRLNDEEKTELNNYMIRYFCGTENSHILYLISKSKSMRPRENFENEIKGFYSELNHIPEISVVLQVIQYADNLEIAFDFDKEDVSHMDPRHAVTTKGITEFKSGRLYVGFKRETHLQESERLGTLAHELTHIAMQILYKNDCNPYGKHDTEKQKEFKELVNYVRNHWYYSSGVEDILHRVFNDYANPDDWPAELIARVPHILAKYGTDEGLDILQKQAPLVYAFYTKHVMHTCTEFVHDSFLIKPRNMIRLLNQYLGVINEFQHMNIWFEQAYDLYEFLQSESKNVMLLGTSSTLLSSISIYQALQKLPQYSLDNSSLFIRISSSEDVQLDIIHTFSSEACNMMVVELHEEEHRVSRLLTELYHVFRSNRRKKVIFIVKLNNLSVLRTAVNISKLKSRTLEVHDREFTLNELSLESQKVILERPVNFQGNEIALKDLLYNIHKNTVDSETLTKLVKNEKIIVGNNLPELGEIKNYYIKRRLRINEEISDKIFDDDDVDDLFFLSGSHYELRSNLKLHKSVQNSSESENEQFSKLCAENPELNIHWLKHEEGRLFWVLTKGKTSSLNKHRMTYRHREYSVREILHEKTRQKVIIISDPAGMGKSTIMTVFAQKMKHYSPDSPKMWIERIDLNDFNDELSQVSDKNKKVQFDVKSATEFLITKIFKFKNIFEQNLFTKYIETERAVSLLFDGFDEISPVYTDVVMDLLKALKKSCISKLFITTRPTMTTLLEEELDAFSHSMVPFTEKNENHFLVQFWKHRFNLIDESENQRLADYATKVMKKLSVSLSESKTVFAVIPLHTRMVAEIFPEKNDFDGNTIPENLDLLTLYELFIDKKYNIYKKEKVKPITAVAEDAVEQSRPISIEHHQRLALHSLFPKEFSRLVSDDELEDIDSNIVKIVKGQERTGMINKAKLIKDTTRLIFIHRSFSEYFVADFITTKLRRKKQNSEVQKFLLTEILTAPQNELIRIFLNAKLARQPFEGVVLNMCGELINEFWLYSREKICTENEQTILHLAVKERNEEIISFIMSSIKNNHILKKFINNEDSAGLSAIQEAAKDGNAKVIKWLVEKGADVNAVDNDGKTVLFYALRYNHSNLANFLIENGADVKSVDIQTLYLYLDEGSQRLEIIKMLVNAGADIKVEDKHGETVLHYAAEQGDTEFIQWLIKEGKADVNDEDSEGTKLIHRSASSDNWELVKWLIQHGNADANVKDRVGNTLLHYAAFKGRLDIVQWLVKPRGDGGGGADINASGELDSSVLHDAAISGNQALVEWLVTSAKRDGGGLDINVRDEGGRTPLHEAALFGHLGLVRWFVKSQEEGGGGADISVEDSDGETALYSAASFGQLELVQPFLDKLDNAHIPDKDGRMVLHVAAAFGEVSLVAKLLDDGISDVSTKDKLGRSALHYAAEHNNHEVVRLLLDSGASTDDKDNEGRQAVHYAASTGINDIEMWLNNRYVDVHYVTGLEDHEAWKKICFTLSPRQRHLVKFLRDKKFQINKENDEKLNFTVDALSTLKLLVQRGSDVNVADKAGKTALYYAVFLTDRGVVGWEVVQWLMKLATSGGGGADVNAVDMQGRTMLHEMAKHDTTYILDNWLKLLPDAELLVNAMDNDGRTPLHEAAQNFASVNASMIKLLIENGANVNASDNKGRTALHEASKYGNLDCVKVLLDSEERWADVNAKDNDGRTALHEACAAGNLQVAKFVVLKNADINSKDKDGRTPLHYAAMTDKLKVVKWLIEKKVTNYKDNFGKTAFDLAQENKFEEVVKEMINEHFAPDSRNEFDDLLRLNEHAKNLELSPIPSTSSSNGCSSENRKRRHVEICSTEDDDNYLFPYEPLEDKVPMHLSRRSNMYMQISMAVLFETSLHVHGEGRKTLDKILTYNRYIGDIISEEEGNKSLREKMILQEHYEDTWKFFEVFSEHKLLSKIVPQNDLRSIDEHTTWLFDNGQDLILVLKSTNRYILYSQYLNYKTIFETKEDLSFDHIGEFCKSFLKWHCGSTELMVFSLASNLPPELTQHIRLTILRNPTRVAPDSVFLATEYSGVIEQLPVKIVKDVFFLDGKLINMMQLHPNFFMDNRNAITVRLDTLSDALLSLRTDEVQTLMSIIHKYTIPVDYKFVQELCDEEKFIFEVYHKKMTKMFTGSMVSAELLSQISWEALGEGLESHPSINSELARKILNDLKDIHKSSSAGAMLKGIPTQTLFFLPDIIKSVNYGDMTTVSRMGAMLTGDAAVNHLYGTLVNKLAGFMPVGRAELLSRLPVTSPIFKALTIYSIVELHKQLQSSSTISEERDNIKHKLAEQYVTLGLMAAEFFGFELSPLWIGLILEQLIFDAETLRKHYHINVSLWEALLMSLGFEQGKLHTILEERELVIRNLKMSNEVINLYKILYGWTIVKIPQLGELEWRNAEESQIPTSVRENIYNQKSALSFTPVAKEISEAGRFRLIKLYKQRKKVLYGTATVTRGKIISSRWQKSIYKANPSKTNITFSSDDNFLKSDTQNNNYFLESYSGDVSNWHKVRVKETAAGVTLKNGENIVDPVRSADNVAIYINNNSFVDLCAQNNWHVSFDPREGDIELYYTSSGLEEVDKFNHYNSMHTNNSQIVESSACNQVVLLTIQVGHKFYTDFLEFPNQKGEFLLRDESHNIFSHYVITGNTEYTIKDFAQSTSIDLVLHKPKNETLINTCNEINGGPTNFLVDTWQCLKEKLDGTSYTRNLRHVNSASMLLSSNKVYLRINIRDLIVSHALILSAMHIDIEEARGKMLNYSRIDFGAEVASFNTSLRGNIVVSNNPVVLHVVGEIPIQVTPVYYGKSAHNTAISLYEIKVDNELKQILSSMSRRVSKQVRDSVTDIEFSYYGVHFHLRNELPENNIINIIGYLSDKTTSLQINQYSDKLILLNEDKSTAAIVFIHHTLKALIEDGVNLYKVISTEKLKLNGEYYNMREISGMIPDLLNFITTFDYIKNILVFKASRGYYILHCLRASTKMRSKNVDYIVRDGIMCATGAKENIINGRDLIEYSSANYLLQPAMNCGVCFQKNLNESHITVSNNSIIVDDLVLDNVRKGTAMYFGGEEIFPAAAVKDTLLGRGQFTGDDGEEDETLESDVAVDKMSLSGRAGSEGRRRARRAEDEGLVTASSAAPTVSSAVNRVLRTLKERVVETWHSLPGEAWLGLVGGGHAVCPGNLAFDGPNSQVSLSQFQLDGTLGLLDLVVRKLSGARPVAGEEEPPSLLEVQGQVLSIVAEFEDLLKQLSREHLISSQESVFDPAALQKRLVSMLVNGPNVDPGEILYNSLCGLWAENHKRKVFLMARIRSMIKAL